MMVNYYRKVNNYYRLVVLLHKLLDTAGDARQKQFYQELYTKYARLAPTRGFA